MATTLTPRTTPADVQEPITPVVVDDVAVFHVPDPSDDAPPSTFLDLDPRLVRNLRNGIVIGFLFVLAAIAIPLGMAEGAAYGLGVGLMAAFWCGTGFGVVMGAAAYSLQTHQ